jgi:hypothetical protein
MKARVSPHEAFILTMDGERRAEAVLAPDVEALRAAGARRWLKGDEIHRLLHSFRAASLSAGVDVLQRPECGRWFLYAPTARVRQDGWQYAKRDKGGHPVVAESHVHLAVGNKRTISAYYSARADEPSKCRRIYWLHESEFYDPATGAATGADPAARGVGLVHYLDTGAGGAGGEEGTPSAIREGGGPASGAGAPVSVPYALRGRVTCEAIVQTVWSRPSGHGKRRGGAEGDGLPWSVDAATNTERAGEGEGGRVGRKRRAVAEATHEGGGLGREAAVGVPAIVPVQEGGFGVTVYRAPFPHMWAGGAGTIQSYRFGAGGSVSPPLLGGGVDHSSPRFQGSLPSAQDAFSFASLDGMAQGGGSEDDLPSLGLLPGQEWRAPLQTVAGGWSGGWGSEQAQEKEEEDEGEGEEGGAGDDGRLSVHALEDETERLLHRVVTQLATLDGDGRTGVPTASVGTSMSAGTTVGAPTPIRAHRPPPAPQPDGRLVTASDPTTGQTLLHAAVAIGSAALVAALLAAGADPRSSASGVTPLSLARSAGHADISALLERAAPAHRVGEQDGDADLIEGGSLSSPPSPFVHMTPTDRGALLDAFSSLSLRDRCAVAVALGRDDQAAPQPYSASSQPSASAAAVAAAAGPTRDAALALGLMTPREQAETQAEARRIQAGVRAWLARRNYEHTRSATRRLQEAIRRMLATRRAGRARQAGNNASLSAVGSGAGGEPALSPFHATQGDARAGGDHRELEWSRQEAAAAASISRALRIWYRPNVPLREGGGLA